MYFSFSVKWNSAPALQIIQQNGPASPGLPERINAVLVPLFSQGSQVGPLRLVSQNWVFQDRLESLISISSECQLYRAEKYTQQHNSTSKTKSQFKVCQNHKSVKVLCFQESQFWDVFPNFPFLKVCLCKAVLTSPPEEVSGRTIPSLPSCDGQSSLFVFKPV